MNSEDTSKLYVTIPDTIIIADLYNVPEYYRIDVDKDGINDFQFRSIINHTPSIMTSAEISISCINIESYIYTRYVIDTTFLNTRIDTFPYYNVPQIKIWKTYGCERMSVNDTVKEIKEMRYVKVMKNNDTITYNDVNWISGRSELSKQDYTFYYADQWKTGNWNVVEHRIHEFGCNLFPKNQVGYITIKKVVEGKTKLGWIKLNIIGDTMFYIIAFAIQK